VVKLFAWSVSRVTGNVALRTLKCGQGDDALSDAESSMRLIERIVS
jgi:hypothetical protein